MIRKIVFDDEISIWWDRLSLEDGEYYAIYKDGVLCEKTTKTHYEIKDLQADSEVEIGVEICSKYHQTVQVLLSETVKMPKRKKLLDVSKEPYLAIGDGKTINTKVLQKAINDCGKNEKVYFPKGIFLTGALKLHSNVELYFEEGAILQGTANVQDYLPQIKSRYEGIERACYQSLLNVGELDHNKGYTTKNIVLRGKGEICGGGQELLHKCVGIDSSAWQKNKNGLYRRVKEEEIVDWDLWRSRGRLIHICNTQNVIIYGLKLAYSPSWNIHMIYSKDITTACCRIESVGVNNGDGWNPDSSENCTLYGTIFNTGDDCVAIKSGKNPEGNVINRACKNIKVFDCFSIDGHGYSIGSEMSGGVENVSFWDCDLINTVFGLQIKATAKRGGYVRNVQAHNCNAPCVMIWMVNYNDDGESANKFPLLYDYNFENLLLTGAIMVECDEPPIVPAIKLLGLMEEEAWITNVRFKNIKIIRQTESTVDQLQIRNVKELKMENVISK